MVASADSVLYCRAAQVSSAAGRPRCGLRFCKRASFGAGRGGGLLVLHVLQQVASSGFDRLSLRWQPTGHSKAQACPCVAEDVPLLTGPQAEG